MGIKEDAGNLLVFLDDPDSSMIKPFSYENISEDFEHKRKWEISRIHDAMNYLYERELIEDIPQKKITYLGDSNNKSINKQCTINSKVKITMHGIRTARDREMLYSTFGFDHPNIKNI